MGRRRSTWAAKVALRRRAAPRHMAVVRGAGGCSIGGRLRSNSEAAVTCGLWLCPWLWRPLLPGATRLRVPVHGLWPQQDHRARAAVAKAGPTVPPRGAEDRLRPLGRALLLVRRTRTKARRDGGVRGRRLLTSGQRQRHVAHLRVLAHARRPEARRAPVTRPKRDVGHALQAPRIADSQRTLRRKAADANGLLQAKGWRSSRRRVGGTG